MNAPLSKKLNEVKWGEFKITDIFDVKNTHNILSNEIAENSGNVPYLCASAEKNGVSTYISYNDDLIDKGNCIFIGGKTFVVTYQEKDFFSNDSHNLALYLKFSEKRKKDVQIFIASCIARSVGYKYSWGNSISHKKIQNDYVSLPVTPENKIDFDFMEAFIRELEEERIRELAAYLKVSGFDNYKLSKCESEALAHLNELKWKEFRIGDLYNKIELHNLNFDKKKDASSEKSEKYSLPIVNAKHGENGIMFYGDKNIFDSEEMTIDIVQNGAVATGDVYPQPQRTGVLWDAYLIKSIKHKDSRESLFYFTATIQKSIKQKFCYEFKATWERVKEEMIFLPVTSDGSPDYAFMENFISAVQKLVIKDVVLYADKKIAATKQAVHKNPSDYKTPEGFGTLEVAEHN